MKFKTPLSVLVASAFCLTFANSAFAQGVTLPGGNISMGPNGPLGSFGTGVGNVSVGPNGGGGTFTTGVINGRVNVGPGGVNANTNLGSFGFSLPGGTNNNGIVTSPNQGGVNYGGGGMGPQGQIYGGWSTGAGSFGSAYSSQGATGDQAHQSDTTNTKFQGDSGRTRKNNNAIYERMRNNLLSTFSVDPSPVPSASFDYGFPSGMSGWGSTIRRSVSTGGWYLPPTSTSSFDGNIVSP